MEVGDTVYWEGEFFAGYAYAGGSLESGYKTQFLSGENKIVEIGNKIDIFDWGKEMVKLDNGKIFGLNEIRVIKSKDETS